MSDRTHWGPTARRLFLALALLACASLTWSVHPWYDATHDGSMYIATARALRAGEGYSYLGEPFVMRPPGFALLIAPWCDGAESFRALNTIVGLWGVAALLALYALVLPRLGPWCSAALALCLWGNPGFQRMSNQVMSDVPGLALLCGCLLVARWAGRATSWRRELLLALAIGLSSYLRHGLVLLVPAILAARLLGAESPAGGRGWRRLWLTPLTVALLLAPWSLRNALCPPELPIDQTLHHSYTTGLWHSDIADPNSPRLPISEVLGRASVRVPQVLAALGNRVRGAEETNEEGTEPPAPGLDARGLALALLALITLIRRRRASELYLAGFAALVIVYFGFKERLVLPLFVLGLAAACETVIWPFERAGRERWGRALAASLLVGLTLLDWAPRHAWKAIEARHAAYQRVAGELAAELASSRRPAAAVGWHYAVHLGRPVWSLSFSPPRKRRAGPGIEATLDRRGIDLVFATGLELHDAKLAAWMRQRFGPARRRGEIELWRTKP